MKGLKLSEGQRSEYTEYLGARVFILQECEKGSVTVYLEKGASSREKVALNRDREICSAIIELYSNVLSDEFERERRQREEVRVERKKDLIILWTLTVAGIVALVLGIADMALRLSGGGATCLF